MEGLVAVVTYGLLTLVWGSVFVLALRRRGSVGGDALLGVVLLVLALDAFKTLLESVVFGLSRAAHEGVLPHGLSALGEGVPFALVKWTNLGVAVGVLVLLARRWLPAELARRNSALQQAEAQLERTRDDERKLRLAVSASSDFTWEADLVTGRISGSDGAARWLGYEPAEFPPDPWYLIVHPDDRARLLAAVKNVIKGRATHYRENHRVVRKDGSIGHAQASGVASFGPDGRARTFVGAVRDITAEVEAEAARAQAQKLEGLGLLAGGIAHDFNNLLTIISSSVDTARQTPDPEVLQTAAMAVRRARLLTRQLLAYAGRAQLTREPVDLNELVQSLSELLTVSVPRKVTLTHTLAPALPAVHGDVAQLQQVVMNLVTNAAEAIGDAEGAVTLETRALTLPGPLQTRTGTVEGHVVQLTVTDSGCGLSGPVLERIFDPFFSTKGAGRGLGLSVLAGIVATHHGALEVDSEPGRGTTFRLSFPALAQPLPKVEPKAAPVEGKLKLHVLLVDDEPLLRRATRRMLQLLGCTVEEAETGRAAVERVSRDVHAWDVVLMDQTMPELSGSEAAAQMRALNPKLRIILSSGYSEHELAAEGLLTLDKPYTVDELEAALRRAMRSKPGL